MCRNFRDDYIFGIKSENNTLPIFNKFFKTDFKKLDRFNTFDFESDKIFLEIKTRTCKSTDYPTTMIPVSKLKKAQTITKDIYFIFIFKDNIYYIKYCPTIFDTFEKKLFVEFDVGAELDLQKQTKELPQRIENLK